MATIKKTVPETINSLRYSETRATKDSFKLGYKRGEAMAFWTSYTKETAIKVVRTARYLGADKDQVAYRVGMAAAYIDKRTEEGRFREIDALTFEDLGVLGLKKTE